MKVIIAGSRSFEYTHGNKLVSLVADAVLASKFKITEIVSGHAQGIDQAGEFYAQTYKIPCKIFYPEWNKHGRSAGVIRNLEMTKYADALIVIWDGKSHGTKNMIDTANRLGLPVYEHFRYEPDYQQLSLFGED